MEGLAAFDLFALAVLFFSGLMALMRGFVREALTITAFVAAALAALWTRPVLAGLLIAPTGSALLANLISMVTVFLLVYLAVSFVTGSLQKNVKSGEDVTTINRTLGFVFGLVRGVVLLGMLVLVLNNTMPGANPAWLTSARVYPVADAAARLLQSLAPEGSWASQTAPNSEEELDREGLDSLIERNTRYEDRR